MFTDGNDPRANGIYLRGRGLAGIIVVYNGRVFDFADAVATFGSAIVDSLPRFGG